jgi:glucans biosynthesis protein
VINPMRQSYETPNRHLRHALKCGARTRAGGSCEARAIRGRRRCRLHGGLSPGAPRGPKNGNFKNGDWTAEAIAERKWLRSLVRDFAKYEAMP